jgi:hypothetical protein
LFFQLTTAFAGFHLGGSSFVYTPIPGGFAVPHTYRVEGIPGATGTIVTLFIDGAPVLGPMTAPASPPGYNAWYFGDRSTNGTDIDWDYIRIRNGPLCTGVGQKNSVAATLSCVVNGVETSGICAGPHGQGQGTLAPSLITNLAGKTLNLVWSGPPGMPFVLALGPPAPASASFGCIGTLDIVPLLFLFDGTSPFGSAFFTLDACGLAQQSLTIPGPPVLPPGTAIGNLQGAIVQAAGAACPLVITAAFYLSS